MLTHGGSETGGALRNIFTLIVKYYPRQDNRDYSSMRTLPILLAFAAAAQNWPSFRGPGASGVADRQSLPVSWDAAHGTHIFWKTPIAGLAHSSLVVWQDQVFVTTAVSSRAGASFKPGLYGEGTASDDLSVQKWKLICLDRRTGR